jgi:tRNA pseudouridine38-40 synthase
MRYFLQISYKGNRYKGWQKQKNTTGCIQEILEEAIIKTTKNEHAALVGCGRTDAGVHASLYFAHIDWPDASLPNFLKVINFNLPYDIVIHRIFEVNENLHARFDACERSYEYHMHFFLDPFLHQLSSYYDVENLDEEAMKSACKVIASQVEFLNFCKTPMKNKHTKCYVKSCDIVFNEDKSKAVVYITSNRFLKSMVRILVAELLEVGQSKMTVEDFRKMFEVERQTHISKLAHPQGLFLTDVKY